ncbi:gametogenetin-binding protein 1-like [Meriones unguiculatus]|uniref:gametogenetin-binding protein 1-like n=1 Tax=Meriones unguiculatus TaxID=10047 RepID=UPI000B4E9BD9|nr:gametogenetin-binding protein 1-like [Meriones unguiculatus]XP_060225121.1 gametogenetin-binding protein 1-like [Meriones unguiculatus]
MAAQARTPRSRPRILGCSSVLRFLRSLVGSKGSSKGPNTPLTRSRPNPPPEQDAASPRVDHGEDHGRGEPQLHTAAPRILSAAPPNPPLQDAFGLGTGDTGSQTSTCKRAPKLRFHGTEVTSVPSRGAEEVLGHLSEKKKRHGEEPAGEASGASDREHCTQALEAAQECLQWVPGPLALTPGVFVKEEEDGHCLMEIRDLRLSSRKVGPNPWNYILGLYKQLHKSALGKAQRPGLPQFPLKDGLPHEEKGEREEAEEEESCANLCAPRPAAFPSLLQKTFRSTDTVGFVESELKKILAVQRECRLWKVGSPEGRELMTRPDITLEEAGMVDGQHLLLEEMDEMGNWPPPE